MQTSQRRRFSCPHLAKVCFYPSLLLVFRLQRRLSPRLTREAVPQAARHQVAQSQRPTPPPRMIPLAPQKTARASRRVPSPRRVSACYARGAAEVIYAARRRGTCEKSFQAPTGCAERSGVYLQPATSSRRPKALPLIGTEGIDRWRLERYADRFVRPLWIREVVGWHC